MKLGTKQLLNASPLPRRTSAGAARPTEEVGVFRVLVADDRAIVRTGLSTLVNTLEEMEVVGVA